MAKNKTVIERDRVRTAKSQISRYQKYKPERLSKSTREGLAELQQELYGKRTMTASQKERYGRLIRKAEREQEVAERVQWEYRKKVSTQQLEEKTARKVMAELDTIKSPKEKAKRREEIYKQYEKGYSEDIQSRVEKLKDRDYKKTYYEYSTEDRQAILRRYLGIGSRGVELTDGTTFTVDEFNAILARHKIPLERFSDKDDIARERYKAETYKDWKKSINDDIKQLLSLNDLTPRELEGLKRMFKLWG